MNCYSYLRACALFTAAGLLCACTQRGASDESATAADVPSADSAQVPVRVDIVRQQTIEVVVSAPGRTEALRQDRIRAPFASRLISLRVADGDHVEQGQILAVVVAKNSAAALEGAEQMLAAAQTEADKADAKRAVELARGQLVQQSLRAPASGIVLSHSAEAGDYVDESEVLLTIAPAGAVFFDAQVAQSDVNRVRAGQVARIDLPAVSVEPVSAIVHGSLPMASSENFSAPVRLDFSPARTNLEVGLFGEASIVVGQHAEATVVPATAVLRDDVSGVTQIALVESGVAHWVTVGTGVQQGDLVEIVRPPIEPGARVITDGQVGLPDGVKVVVQP
jgi:RND family efflux transporter MFP subunit